MVLERALDPETFREPCVPLGDCVWTVRHAPIGNVGVDESVLIEGDTRGCGTVSLVWLGRTVLDVLLTSVAMDAAAAQFGVEGVERLDIETSQLRCAEQPLDVDVALRQVAAPRLDTSSTSKYFVMSWSTPAYART